MPRGAHQQVLSDLSGCPILCLMVLLVLEPHPHPVTPGQLKSPFWIPSYRLSSQSTPERTSSCRHLGRAGYSSRERRAERAGARCTRWQDPRGQATSRLLTCLETLVLQGHTRESKEKYHWKISIFMSQITLRGFGGGKCPPFFLCNNGPKGDVCNIFLYPRGPTLAPSLPKQALSKQQQVTDGLWTPGFGLLRCLTTRAQHPRKEERQK